MIKFAVIGQGHIGKRHAEMIRRDNNSQLVAVCDILKKEDIGLADIKEAFFNNSDIPLFGWDENDIVRLLEQAGFSVTLRMETLGEKRIPSAEDIAKWFNPDTSPYGKGIAETLGQEKTAEFRSCLEKDIIGKELTWNSAAAFIFFTENHHSCAITI